MDIVISPKSSPAGRDFPSIFRDRCRDQEAGCHSGTRACFFLRKKGSLGQEDQRVTGIEATKMMTIWDLTNKKLRKHGAWTQKIIKFGYFMLKWSEMPISHPRKIWGQTLRPFFAGTKQKIFGWLFFSQPSTVPVTGYPNKKSKWDHLFWKHGTQAKNIVYHYVSLFWDRTRHIATSSQCCLWELFKFKSSTLSVSLAVNLFKNHRQI